MIYIVGLGNPGDEYQKTRHNVGRMAVEELAAHFGIAESEDSFKYDKILNARKIKGSICDKEVLLLVPETYMNESGKSLVPLIFGTTLGQRIGAKLKSKAELEKVTENIIVIQDDIDLPLGQVRVFFKRGTGGHKGIESINKSIKTDAYIRIKIGVAQVTPTGEMKKNFAGENVVDFVLGKFQTHELQVIEKSFAKVFEIVKTIIKDGRVVAMNEFN